MRYADGGVSSTNLFPASADVFIALLPVSAVDDLNLFWSAVALEATSELDFGASFQLSSFWLLRDRFFFHGDPFSRVKQPQSEQPDRARLKPKKPTMPSKGLLPMWIPFPREVSWPRSDPRAAKRMVSLESGRDINQVSEEGQEQSQSTLRARHVVTDRTDVNQVASVEDEQCHGPDQIDAHHAHPLFQPARVCPAVDGHVRSLDD